MRPRARSRSRNTLPSSPYPASKAGTFWEAAQTSDHPLLISPQLPVPLNLGGCAGACTGREESPRAGLEECSGTYKSGHRPGSPGQMGRPGQRAKKGALYSSPSPKATGGRGAWGSGGSGVRDSEGGPCLLATSPLAIRKNRSAILVCCVLPPQKVVLPKRATCLSRLHRASLRRCGRPARRERRGAAGCRGDWARGGAAEGLRRPAAGITLRPRRRSPAQQRRNLTG